jgi:hypothetical protein
VSAWAALKSIPRIDLAPAARWELPGGARKFHAINDDHRSLCWRFQFHFTPLPTPLKIQVGWCCCDCLAAVLGLA